MIEKILLLLSIVLIYKTEEKFGVTSEDNVVVLGTKNFDDFVNKYDFVMVEFYAPWCGHCKSLAPKYSELAKMMADEHEIPLAKVDATVEGEIATRYKVQGYPTIKLFIKGSPIDYKGAREVDAMKEFILNKKKDPSTEVKTTEELNKLKNENKVIVVFFGEEGDNFNSFKVAALGYDNLKFYHVFEKSMFEEFKAENNSVVLFKDFDEKENRIKGKYTSENLSQFVETNRYPTVMEFDQETAEKIFGKEESAIFLFREKANDMDVVFTEVAKELKSKINFSVSTVTSGLGAKLAEFVGVEQKDAPCVRIVQFKNQNLDKFKLKEEFNKENLKAFIQNFLDNKLEQYHKSQPIPENNDGPVKVVVGDNFEKIVLDDSKHVLIEAYAPWCGHCKQLAPIYEQLGEKLKNHPDIVIAKMDATANEYPGFDVKGFPTIKLYRKGKKSVVLDFDGGRDLEGFIKYLEQFADLKLDEEKKPEL